MSSTPYRRCWHMDERGQQCETWFPAVDDSKLCVEHSQVASPSARNGVTEEQKVRYIDLVNDAREYCYHFKDGEAQKQDKTLIFEFKDDIDGTAFEKLDRHIAFLDKVLEDVKARHQSVRAVRAEKLDKLTEDERKELRKIRYEPREKTEKSKETKTEKVKTEWKEKLSKLGSGISLDMDVDAMLAKFEEAKKMKGENE